MEKRQDMSGAVYKRWMKRSKVMVKEYSKAKVKAALFKFFLVFKDEWLFQKAIEELEKKGTAVGVIGGWRTAPMKARKRAEDYDREVRQEIVDKATTVLVFRHLGKRGLKKRNNPQVLELTRVIRVISSALEIILDTVGSKYLDSVMCELYQGKDLVLSSKSLY